MQDCIKSISIQTKPGLFSVVLLALLAMCSIASASEVLPNIEGSYIANAALLKNSGERTFNDILRSYDQYIRNHPTDLATRIEECKFIQQVMEDEVVPYGVADDSLERRLNEIAARFPDDYEATVYRSTMVGSDSCIALLEKYLRARGDTVKGHIPWALFEQLARSYSAIERPYNVIHYGVEAMRGNDTLDLTLVVAEACEQVGNRKLAVTYMLKFLNKESPCWVYKQKGDLLLKLSENNHAVKMYNRAAQCDTSIYTLSALGKALAKLDKYAEARTALSKADPDGDRPASTLLALFRLELRHGERDSALSAYNALRDNGLSADPLGKYRLQLAFRHPSAPWQWRDVGGLLLLLFSIIIIPLVPALWIVPIHYAGLVKNRVPEPSRWNLKHWWFISAAFIMSSFICLILFEYEAVTNIFTAYGHVGGLETATVAYSMLVFSGLLAVSCLMLVRRIDFVNVWGTQWSRLKSILAGIGFALLLRVGFIVAFFILVELLKVEGLTRSPNEYFRPLAAGIWEEIRAVKETFGWPLLVFVVAILVPLYEEFMFRGVALRSMQRYVPFFWANAAQAILFGCAHGELVQGVYAFIIGMIAGVMRRRSSSLVPGISLHVTNNFMALLPYLG